eukprot:5059008-Pyramimonas_sp.AAC.1
MSTILWMDTQVSTSSAPCASRWTSTRAATYAVDFCAPSASHGRRRRLAQNRTDPTRAFAQTR